MSLGMLIGIHGKPRAGKDTLAAYLKDKYDLCQYGPSVPVKQATAAMFDVSIENFNSDELKDTIDEFWGISYREMAQKVGKESSRDLFGDDFWMRRVEKHFMKYSRAYPNGFILADIRYPNEARWVKKQGGTMIFVTREERGHVANEGHAAEQGLPLGLADIIIPNNGTIQDLYDKANIAVGSL